jgi:hypothetical protein
MFDLDNLQMIFSVIIGIVGIGYCSYGRKNNPYYLLCGLGLLLMPLFVDRFAWLFGLGCVLMILPYLLDR